MPVPSSITDLSTTPASNSPAGSETPSSTDDYFRAHASFIAVLRDQGVTKAELQAQTFLAFTTAGTTTAYTLTPVPAITALAAGQRFRVKFNAANTTTGPTLNINGLGAVALKVYNSAGAKVAPEIGAFSLDMLTNVEYDGTDMVVLDPLPEVTKTGLAPVFGVRAWLNYKGTAARLIRASGNVASVTVNGAGDFTINFSTAMPNANYSVSFGYAQTLGVSGASARTINVYSRTTSALRIICMDNTGVLIDFEEISLQVVG